MRISSLALLIGVSTLFSHAALAESPEKHGNNIKTINHAFHSGEKLTYSISWSKILQAGVVVMEVRAETTPEGKKTYRITSSAKSVGIVSAFYSVRDTVQSIMDAEGLSSLWFSLDQKHGKRKKHREMTFDHAKGTVRLVKNGKEETFEVPQRIQDSLSSLYYLRTRQDFSAEKPIVIDVHEGGKNWSVEIQVLGREKLKTPLGEFDTIKVRTYPKYEGVFMHKAEIFIWLTDDAGKVPLLMKSEIAIGSIIATLTELKLGEEAP
jgi:hypothetical protein